MINRNEDTTSYAYVGGGLGGSSTTYGWLISVAFENLTR